MNRSHSRTTALALSRAYRSEPAELPWGDIRELVNAATASGLDYEKSVSRESDGSWSAEIHDPEGNVIYLNTFPEERERYRQTSRRDSCSSSGLPLGIHRVHVSSVLGVAAAENEPSCRVLEKAGFTLIQEAQEKLHGNIRKPTAFLTFYLLALT